MYHPIMNQRNSSSSSSSSSHSHHGQSTHSHTAAVLTTKPKTKKTQTPVWLSSLSKSISPLQWCVVALLYVVWWNSTTTRTKIIAILGACGYSCIEYTWYTVTTEDEHGHVIFTPGEPTCRQGFTTFAQWWANVLYIPILLHVYHAIVPIAWLRLVLFPFNVWVLEIVEGYFLMLVYGRNVAWDYTDSQSYFHGNITLSHWNVWLVLGLVVEALSFVVPYKQ
jgi:hypothetical protein